MQRRALAFLFVAITAGFGLIAIAAAGARQWPIAVAAAALALWMAGLAVRGLRRR